MLRAPAFFALLFLLLLTAHLCHVGVLWEPETFPLAAASQLLHGHRLYSGIWYDKPPLAPLWHAVFLYAEPGTPSGWILRIAGALHSLGCAALAYGFAREFWGRREAFWAASFLAFFLTFDFPASVLPLGPDLLMVAPHLAAVWLAWRGQPILAGVAAALAFLANTKGIFVLATCLLFAGTSSLLVLVGFAIPVVLCAAVLISQGSLDAYQEQVWLWSSLYAANSSETNPFLNGMVRTGNWLGFHAALTVASLRRLPWRFALWIALSAAAVLLGLRFFPRYYLQLLPPLSLTAAYGAARLRRWQWLLVPLLLVPVVRFTPGYLKAARDTPWADTALDRDSRRAAALLKPMTATGDTLFVWGYRPELWVYTGLPDATRFLDSQPLTGVPADRHLTRSEPIDRERPLRARQELLRTHPTFVLDGLSLYNPRLSPGNYPELRGWFAGYREVARTNGIILYRRADTIVK